MHPIIYARNIKNGASVAAYNEACAGVCSESAMLTW